MAKTRPAKIPHGGKPAKPYQGFPLTAHPSGQWSKKIRQKVHYFGVWADPEAALDLYLAQRDDLHAGRTPDRGEGLTVKELVNCFLETKEGRVKSGELSPRTLTDYVLTCGTVLKEFGKATKVRTLRPRDFEKLRAAFAKTHGPVRLGKDVTCVRTLFRYCDDAFDLRVKVGDGFKKPGKSVLRRIKQGQPKRMFEAAELRSILALLETDRKVTVKRKVKQDGTLRPALRENTRYASPALKAMVLLGVNAGLGNHDVAALTFDRINGEWLDFPRIKTSVPRRAKLWPETITAIEAAKAVRPEPAEREFRNLVFLTKRGGPWEGHGEDEQGRAKIDDPVAKEFAKIIRELGMGRRGRGFYACRHVCNTIGLQTGDRAAVQMVMGHTGDDDMTENYNQESVSDARLERVAEHIRGWLFPA